METTASPEVVEPKKDEKVKKMMLILSKATLDNVYACFILANGELLLEAMDPNPIDNQKYTKVGLEAYCSKIKIRNITIRQINWEAIEMKYEPDF